MKKVFLLLVSACFSILASAQKVYFIYLQTEDQSPFYVRMGDKIYSSAASGYLILPNLIDTTYSLSLGYARSNEPEARFSVAVNQGDRGFLVKKFEDGLGLFDFLEMSVVKANESAKDNTVYTTKTDNFSNLLSKAAADPTLVKVPVRKQEEPAKVAPQKRDEVLVKADDSKLSEKAPEPVNTSETTEPAKTTAQSSTEAVAITEVQPTASKTVDSTAVQQSAQKEATTTVQTESKVESAPQDLVFKPSTVIRRSESSTTEGFGVLFYDQNEGQTDTIRILIPAGKVRLVAESDTKPVADMMLTKEVVDSTLGSRISPVEKVTAKDETGAKTESVPSGCNNLASDKDFLRLRKKMAAKESDDSMIDEAKKEFRSRCFTAEQIGFLGSLFLTSAGRYQFFDAAYKHVSDVKNFSSLQSLLTDDYYVKRFKALIGE